MGLELPSSRGLDALRSGDLVPRPWAHWSSDFGVLGGSGIRIGHSAAAFRHRCCPRCTHVRFWSTLGGAVKVALDRYQQSQEKNEQARQTRRQLVEELCDVRSAQRAHD